MKKYKLEIILSILLVIELSLISFTIDPKIDTKVFVSNNMNQIKSTIELHSKYGYKVKLIESQIIAPNQGASFNSYTPLKGDIILIMEK